MAKSAELKLDILARRLRSMAHVADAAQRDLRNDRIPDRYALATLAWLLDSLDTLREEVE